MTAEELREMAELCEKATPGKWNVGTDESVWSDLGTDSDFGICEQYNTGEVQQNWENDAAFIAVARSFIPRALRMIATKDERIAELERELAEQELAEAKDQLTRLIAALAKLLGCEEDAV